MPVWIPEGTPNLLKIRISISRTAVGYKVHTLKTSKKVAVAALLLRHPSVIKCLFLKCQSRLYAHRSDGLQHGCLYEAQHMRRVGSFTAQETLPQNEA